jgi:replicative DNA helicase
MENKEQQTRETLARKGKRTSAGVDYLDHGRVPPQAVDLEEAVLGAMLLEQDAVSNVIDIFKEEVFYKEAHQKIFAAILSLFSDSKPVDILTVTQELKKQGNLELVGGAYYVSQLTNRVASAANVEYHARIVLQKVSAAPVDSNFFGNH